MKLFSNKYYQKTIAIVVTVSFVSTLAMYQVVKADNETDNPDENTICLIDKQPINQTKTEKQLMKEWVLNRVKQAGLNPEEANIIINCESRWNPDAMGINNNRSADLGLWQINSIHKDISNVDKLDYKKATDWAIDKRLKDGHWLAWSCSRKIARQ